MKKYSTNEGRRIIRIAHLAAIFFLALSLVLPSVSRALAQVDSSTLESGLNAYDPTNNSSTVPTNLDAALLDTLLVPENQTSTGAVDQENSVSSTPPSTTVEQDRGPPVVVKPTEIKDKTKFKKDPALPLDAELNKVKQHLIDNGLPQDVVDRVDAYRNQQAESPKQEGFFKKITDFFTGNTDADKERKNIENLANKQPFKVQTFNGQINKKPESDYNKLFSNNKEQGSNLLQKIKNFFNGGKLYNSNFDLILKKKGLTSFLGQEALADVSANPNDYLAAGNEIIFSQAIKDKADALNNSPLTILNYVHNNVDYIPYYGSKKGSDATLIERAGNDMDKSALLIAMLRYSNIPARYRHIDAKMSVSEVTDLLGVQSAEAAAQILTLTNIPYIYFVDSDNNPLFFVIEHTYVEAYIPYGYSRGVDLNDGGSSQWVPMDPTINAYYYEQPVDIIGGMNADGFNVLNFYDNYLNNNYGTSTPIAAFQTLVENYLASSSTPTSTYSDALVRYYPKQQNLSFIPGTLPYQVVVDLNTYDYIPSTLRHTVQFTVLDDQQNTILDYTANVSDLADKELLMTYDPATQADQDTLNTFDTIYDVVPLSLVAVNAKIKINGVSVVTSTATSTLGRNQNYSMVFKAPTREIGSSVSVNTVETQDENIITGNTNAIAINTDRVVPPELRPTADTQTNSFVSNQLLYKSALDYLYRLDQTERELAKVVGADFTHTATRAAIFNGISVTYSNGQPYSFDWKGLRIDSSAKVTYFNRFNDDSTTYKKEFMAIFGLQASLDESNIFEENFSVGAISTVKGLKLVASSTFPGITMRKITSANESDIDSLFVTSTTKTIFHTAVQAGKTVYTPSAPFTYGNWTGLVYITISFDQGIAGYIIGEGLNGGYTVEQFTSMWNDAFMSRLLPSASAVIYSPTNNQTFTIGDNIHWNAQYTVNFGTSTVVWQETTNINSTNIGLGDWDLIGNYGTTTTVHIIIQKPSNPLNINYDWMKNNCYNTLLKTGSDNCTEKMRKPEDIKQVVIHYTAGKTAQNAIDTFNIPGGKSSHYVIDKDENGTIYQLVADKNISYHDGCIRGHWVGKEFECDDEYGSANATIGIELVNYGFLNTTTENGIFRTDGGAVFKPDGYSRMVFDNTTTWGGYRYWEQPHMSQIISLVNLLNFLGSQYAFDVKIFPNSSTPNILDFQNESQQLLNFNGIVGHSNIANYKSDPGPAYQQALINYWGL
ncbi:MAG: N-acetylmuramoyl-L-alanine amidase [Patescibacteria group bacterium]|jgi:N-acetyl-anhydromuramyl-L-alanine amidase AmpD